MSSAPAPTHYVIRGGAEGKRRLDLLTRALWPTTHQLLKRTGVRPGMVCLDMGCGNGGVSAGIARMVGPEGRVIGIDMDPIKVDAAREEAARQSLGNVAFRQAGLYEWSEEQTYDRIYLRCVLTHLPDRVGALNILRRALKPGGVLVVEDIDFTGSFCYPRCAAYERYIDWYRRVVERRGGDSDIGPKLHSLLTAAGLQAVHMSMVHLFHMNQEEKALSLSTLINITESVVSERLAEPAELDRTAIELERFIDDPTTVLSLPRLFQAWGARA